MSTAAVVIDNFLTTDKWNSIQSGISDYINASSYKEERTDLHTQIHEWIESKLTELNLWQSSWKNEVPLFSSINVAPVGLNRESSDPSNGGYHVESGGYIYYIHPTWESSWGGHLKFKNCDVAQIEPTPNRFVWVNPKIWHGIGVVESGATNNRISVVAWPTGTLEYAGADLKINTLV
tara:strand:+ start:40 stop:573 length:534 start_codon:yes stop_codon:yes gene_type:complete